MDSTFRNVDADKLIEEVKKYPPLYNWSDPSYRDHVLKKSHWELIYEALTPQWNSLGFSDKHTRGQEIQKRWNSLRDCFRREVLLQRNPTTKKRRQYVYFHQLSFLLQNFETNQLAYDMNLPIESTGSLNANSDRSFQLMNSTATLPPKRRKKRQNRTVKRPIVERKTQVEEKVKKVEKTISLNKRVMNLVVEKLENDDDMNEDKLFLLSLLPSFKNFSNEQKLTLRMEMMRTILNFAMNQRNGI